MVARIDSSEMEFWADSLPSAESAQWGCLVDNGWCYHFELFWGHLRRETYCWGRNGIVQCSYRDRPNQVHVRVGKDVDKSQQGMRSAHYSTHSSQLWIQCLPEEKFAFLARRNTRASLPICIEDLLLRACEVAVTVDKRTAFGSCEFGHKCWMMEVHVFSPHY